MKLKDVITVEELRARMFSHQSPADNNTRWQKVFEQIEPYANMIALEVHRRRMPIEIGGAYTSVLCALVDHLIDQEKNIS